MILEVNDRTVEMLLLQMPDYLAKLHSWYFDHAVLDYKLNFKQGNNILLSIAGIEISWMQLNGMESDLTSRTRLVVLSFIEGGCIMLVELAGTKMLAPWFGTSLYVWSAVLGVTLGGIDVRILCRWNFVKTCSG